MSHRRSRPSKICLAAVGRRFLGSQTGTFAFFFRDRLRPAGRALDTTRVSAPTGSPRTRSHRQAHARRSNGRPSRTHADAHQPHSRAGRDISRYNSEAAPLIDTCTRRGQGRVKTSQMAAMTTVSQMAAFTAAKCTPRAVARSAKGPAAALRAPPAPSRRRWATALASRRSRAPPRRAPAWSARRPRAGTPTPTPRTRIPTSRPRLRLHRRGPRRGGRRAVRGGARRRGSRERGRPHRRRR